MFSAKRNAVAIGVVLLAVLFAGYAIYGIKPEPSSVTVVHCVGYCNLPLFLAAGSSETPGAPLKISTSFVANPADHAASLTAPNGPIASVTPFTNVLVAVANGAELKIIAGCGVNGLALIASPSYDGPDSLRGKAIGTIPGDTLEQLAYGFLEKHQLVGEVKLIYFTDSPSLIQALRNGDVAAITHVEPFATSLVSQEKMTLVIRGEELWGVNHPDCVLVTTGSALRSRRAELKSLIRMLLDAETRVRNDLNGVVSEVAEPVYQMQEKDLRIAIKSQFPEIDIRGSEGFMLERAYALRQLGRIPSSADAVGNAIDTSLLDEVLGEK